jgi:hypothetical protein
MMTTARWRSTPAAVAVLACMILIAQASEARPLYAARTGKPCARCHVSPAGGGMRSVTGFAYALNGHTETPAEEVTPTIDPQVSDGIRLGADLRTMYIQEAHTRTREQSTFLQMSAILFASADLNNRATLYYSNDQGRVFETYALLSGLPLQSALRIGRIRPVFGIAEEDHTTFTQDSLGFGTFSDDAGLDLTMNCGIHHLTLGVVNGLPGGAILDNNESKGVIGRLWSYNRRGGIGVSGYGNTPASGQRTYRYGVLGNLSLGPLVFLGEYDHGENKHLSAGPGERRTIRLEAGFAEMSMRLGPDGRSTVKLKYDRFDRDMDLADSARDRVGVWLESDLLPLVRFIGAARGTKSYADNRTFYDFLGQIYLYF